MGGGLELVGRTSWGHSTDPGFLCRRAKLLLRKKRYREQLLDRTESQISSLEAMVGRQDPAGAGWSEGQGWG